jgi:hypothetical protein
MRSTGPVPPTLFLIGEEGAATFIPDNFDNEESKDDFVMTARMICIAHGATACVMVLEAWVKFAQSGEKMDETEPPSEAFDRQEVVLLAGESFS